VLVPQAAPGTWYILVYSAAVPTPGAFTIRAQTDDVELMSVTPDHHGNGAETVMTLTGAGFHAPMTVELVDASGATFPAASVEVDMPTQLTASFAAGAVPAGVYTVRAGLSGGATSDLTNAFTVENGGEAKLVTNLVLPSAVGRHALATIFTVSWSGQDDPGGSGIALYDIYVSDDGGPFTPFLLGTTDTSATFTGVTGHNYGFYSVATDNVGHREDHVAVADTTTTIVKADTTTTLESSLGRVFERSEDYS